MREIKFKLWDTETKSMSLPVNLYKINYGKVDITRWVPLQFTGLKDKNGKEGYHNDLVVNLSRNNGKPHTIEWSNRFGAWVGKYNNLEYLLAQELHECEFVGNKYENPELKSP